MTPAGAGLGLPEGLRALCAEVQRELGAVNPRLADTFGRCFPDNWHTALCPTPDEDVFVVTGDIPAMWLRDSTAQVRPYLLAAHDPEVASALTGVLRRQVRCVLADPYANAFNATPDGATGGHRDEPAPGPLVWERKYEVDSLCAPLQLAYGLWRATGRLDHVDDGLFAEACRRIVVLWRVEQDHEARSGYVFRRIGGEFAADTLPRGGRGASVAPSGMTWSGFRPSDAPCRYGYLMPANALAAVSLAGLAELAAAAGLDDLAADADALSAEIAEGVRRHAVVDAGPAGTVYAYEIDGLGHSMLMDDANVPSLLSLPYLGWCRADDPLYLRTRELVLSEANPWFFRGRHAEGIGSPHTPDGFIWPLALAMQGLTSGSPEDKARLAELLACTDGGTGMMHESFHVDDHHRYTRPWFGWANALFSELVLDMTGRRTADLHPSLAHQTKSLAAEK